MILYGNGVVFEDGEWKDFKEPVEYSKEAVMLSDTRWLHERIGCQELVYNYLRMCEHYANGLLVSRANETGIGFVYLNEIYQMLDKPLTMAGQVIGWIYDKKNPIGDNKVVFKVYNFYDDENIVVDFNHDGNIFQKWEYLQCFKET